MLNDTALIITGIAFGAIVGGALLLRRRAMAEPPPAPVIHHPTVAAPQAAQGGSYVATPAAAPPVRPVEPPMFAPAPEPAPFTAAQAAAPFDPAIQQTAHPAAYARPMPEAPHGVEATYTPPVAPAAPIPQAAPPLTQAQMPAAAPLRMDAPRPTGVGPSAAATHRSSSGPSRIEALVLRTALEDALEHLAEIYGAEFLDSFYARRVRRNVEPYRELVAAASDPAVAQQGLRQAAEAEEALRRAVAVARERAAQAGDDLGVSGEPRVARPELTG